MENKASVIIENNIPLADSREIAKKLGVEHRSFFSLITEYQEEVQKEFGPLRFQISVKENNRGGAQPRYALLTEEQTYVYLTYSKNTEQARECKRMFVKAFMEAKEQLAQPAQQQELPSRSTDGFVAQMDRLTASWQAFRTEMKALGIEPQKEQRHSSNVSKKPHTDRKYLSSPTVKNDPEHIRTRILQSLKRHGSLTLNQLRTSYLKNCDPFVIEKEIHALLHECIIFGEKTSHSVRYALVESESVS